MSEPQLQNSEVLQPWVEWMTQACARQTLERINCARAQNRAAQAALPEYFSLFHGILPPQRAN